VHREISRDARKGDNKLVQSIAGTLNTRRNQDLVTQQRKKDLNENGRLPLSQ
jgi:hypothetical protein